MKRLFSAPTMVNLELTELCNVKCRHCYNFWRDESMGSVSLDEARLDRLIERFVEAGIFHVVVSGGEPMARFNILIYALEKLRENGISVSCNSNMMLVTEERIRRLLDAGLDHILTSIPSCDPLTNDQIMGKIGSYEKIVSGIRIATRNGMRVSANMVVTRKNKHQVYETGKMVAELGVQKLFVTRSVPPTYADTSQEDDYSMTPDEVRQSLDDALRVKQDFGLMIGSLVSYPLCFLGDLEKYADFVGRGCPSQSGHRMSINADGTVHACVHEAEGYGNVLETPIKEIYQGGMRKWHNGSFYYKGCEGCEYRGMCESGCSMMALGHYGAHDQKDPLFVGPGGVYRHFRLSGDPGFQQALEDGLRLVVPKRLRFRKEDGFHLLNIRWANTITISDEMAAFLVERRDSGEPFTLADIDADKRDLVISLFFKDAIEAAEPSVVSYEDRRDRAGLSVNIDDLPLIA